MTQTAIYRNLNSKSSTDLWSIVNASVTRDGYLSKKTGVTHGNDFGISGNIITNNPTSIMNGIARIRKNNSREVVAFVGADNLTTVKPSSTTYIGRLTLNLNNGFQLINESGNTPFNPTHSTVLWFSANGCEVFKGAN